MVRTGACDSKCRNLNVGRLLFGACLLFPSISRAEPHRVLPMLELSWPKLADCPSREDIYRAIVAHLAGTPSSNDWLVAAVDIDRVADYRLTLRTQSRSGQSIREVTGVDCRSVSDAAVVMLAMLLAGEGSDLGEPRVSPNPRLRADTQAGWSPRSGRIRVSLLDLRLGNARRGHTIPLRIGIGGWVTLGLASTPLLGLSLGGSADLRGWRWFAEVGWIPETSLQLRSDSSRGADTTAVNGTLSSGPILRHGAWELVPRVGISGRVLQGSGFGVDMPVQSAAYYGAVVVGEALTLRVTGDLRLQSSLDLSLPWRRPALLLEPGGEVLRPARLGLDACVGMALLF